MWVIGALFGGRWVAGLGLLVVVVLSGPERMSGMSWSPYLIRSVAPDDGVLVRLGHEVVDVDKRGLRRLAPEGPTVVADNYTGVRSRTPM